MPAMLTPRMGNRPPDGMPWAADNGRYASPETYTDAAFLAWLVSRDADRPRCLFATAPDVVGDAAATLALSGPMFAPIRALGYPVALVAQDGLDRLPVPWDDFDALFVGGTTAWKLSEASHGLVSEANARGKWTHMGRVNSLRRLRLAASIGCDSADGTFIKWSPDFNRKRVAGWFADLDTNPMLFPAVRPPSEPAGLGRDPASTSRPVPVGSPVPVAPPRPETGVAVPAVSSPGVEPMKRAGSA